MKNPVLVFLLSLDHHSETLNWILSRAGLYRAIAPVPFEHWCVFCARDVDNSWWKEKEEFLY